MPDPNTHATPLDKLASHVLTLEQRILQLERRNEHRTEHQRLHLLPNPTAYQATPTHMTFTTLHTINPWTHWR